MIWIILNKSNKNTKTDLRRSSIQLQKYFQYFCDFKCGFNKETIIRDFNSGFQDTILNSYVVVKLSIPITNKACINHDLLNKQSSIDINIDNKSMHRKTNPKTSHRAYDHSN